MTLHLRSDRFSVSAQQALCIPPHEDGGWLAAFQEPPAFLTVENNVVTDLLPLSSHTVRLSMFDCVVQSKLTGVTRRIPVISVEGEVVSNPDGVSGHVDLPPYAFLRAS